MNIDLNMKELQQPKHLDYKLIQDLQTNLWGHLQVMEQMMEKTLSEIR